MSEDSPAPPRAPAHTKSSAARIHAGTTWAGLPERYRYVVQARENGASFSEIGRHLGVTRQRAAQMFDRANSAMHPKSSEVPETK